MDLVVINMNVKPITIVIYSLFLIILSSLMTVLFYHVFVFKTFSQEAENNAAFFEVSSEKVLSSPIKENNSIIEVLSYGCHYCSVLDDDISQFAKKLPEGVSFKATHLNINNGEGLSAYAPIFATLEEMGIESELRKVFYDAVINRKISLTDQETLIDFLKQYGIDTNEYLNVSQSKAVQDRLEEMENISKFYQITGTPAFIINKRYVVYQDKEFPEFSAYMLDLLNESKQEKP